MDPRDDERAAEPVTDPAPGASRREFLARLTGVVFLTAGVAKAWPQSGGTTTGTPIPQENEPPIEPPDDGCPCGTKCYTNGGAAQDSVCTQQGPAGNYKDVDCGVLGYGFGWAWADQSCSAGTTGGRPSKDDDCGKLKSVTGGGHLDQDCALGGSDNDCAVQSGGIGKGWRDNDCGTGSTTSDTTCKWWDLFHAPFPASLPP